MTDFLDHLHKISEFLMDLSCRDNIKKGDRDELRSLYHKVVEKILLVLEYQPVIAGQKNPKPLKLIKKIEEKIALFSPWKRSVKDLLPLIEQLIAELDTIIDNLEALKNGEKR